MVATSLIRERLIAKDRAQTRVGGCRATRRARASAEPLVHDKRSDRLPPPKPATDRAGGTTRRTDRGVSVRADVDEARRDVDRRHGPRRQRDRARWQAAPARYPNNIRRPGVAPSVAGITTLSIA
jgi:hypothetical protein